jgi:hypothetical protein
MRSFASSDRVQRGVMWAAVLLLVAGVVAFLATRVTGDDEGSGARPAANAPAAQVDEAAAAKKGEVPRAARVAAGEFILAAAGREDLRKAWQLSHPTLKDQCACTYKEWLTGNIPVQPYPVDNLDVAAFDVEEVSSKHAILLVALVPKDGSDVKPQAFYIGLRATGQGAKKRWLVDYWAPRTTIEVPALPEG